MAAALPVGPAPAALDAPHFPSRLHAFVWRNWGLVPVERMAQVVGGTPEAVAAVGHRMGLGGPPAVGADQFRRSYITIIRRNWHLLPYEQLVALLGWTEEEMAYALREDDFLFVKLGNLKPQAAPLHYAEPDDAARARETAIAASVRRNFPQGLPAPGAPLFGFIADLSAPPPAAVLPPPNAPRMMPRYCYSYFALYGDPLLDPELDPYPDGLLARLAASGADGVWLQGVLYKLAPFPWDPALSARNEERLAALAALVERAKRHGIGVWLYLNEPRSMHADFFARHPELKGVSESEWSAMCTGAPGVLEYIAASVERICRAVPDLAGFFTISASENLTHCWSHYQGAGCARCAAAGPAAAIGALHAALRAGIDRAGSKAQLTAWDWGWQDAWAPQAIAALPERTNFMSVSEWGLPLGRGGVPVAVGEYSISAVGPGPRATRHWALARERGLRALAKVQVGTTWEIGAVPYLPAVAKVAEHAANLQRAGVEGLMLGWTLGGYPSPNLEVVAELSSTDRPDPQLALRAVAGRRFGLEAANLAVRLWQGVSDAMDHFPYDGSVVYNAPLHTGPANLLWAHPTGYRATMVGIPYDDLDAWRGPYPAGTFAELIRRTAEGIDGAVRRLREAPAYAALDADARARLDAECDVAMACALHYRSVAAQTAFVVARDALRAAPEGPEAPAMRARLREIAAGEAETARALHAIQMQDPRIGFEATNHYFYVPQDLAEKVLNCEAIEAEFAGSLTGGSR